MKRPAATRRRRWLAALAAAAAALAWPATSAADRRPPPDAWLTEAERSGFRATADFDDTLDYLRRLDDASPAVRLTDFGRSAQGRPLPLAIVSGRGVSAPEAARAAGLPVVLVQNGIHAGEIDGKDACLMLLRDAVLGLADAAWLDELVLLVVPIYNADGHERVSPHNRPNQDGPVEGMGFRTTADGHDLNRDHMKLDTPEARALARLAQAWRPHLHVDDHVTNGSDHAWVLTTTWVEPPRAPAPIGAWLAEHMPRVLDATRAAGHRTGPYVSLLDRDDPAAGFDSRIEAPRYATGYWSLLNRPSILVENHASKPYRQRVLANRDFLEALLAEVARKPRALLRAVERAERATVAAGRPDAEPGDVVLRWKAAEPATIRFPVYDWHHEPSVVLGVPLLRYRRGEERDLEVPWIHRSAPELTVSRPRGYLVRPGWPAIERRLADHGLRLERLSGPVTLEAETLRVARDPGAPPPGESYQGRTRLPVVARRRTETVRLPAGTLWIPADQPDFELAVQLLEPEAGDSLVAWGLLSQVLEHKESIAPRVLEHHATRLLAADPELAEAWRLALEDGAFAGDPGARYEWWYRRTPYWDDTVGLLPILRLTEAPAFDVVAP